MTKEDAKRILDCSGIGYTVKDFNNALEVASLPSNIDEAIDKYTDNHANYLEYSDDGWEDKTDIDYVERAFKAGAEWMAKQGKVFEGEINAFSDDGMKYIESTIDEEDVITALGLNIGDKVMVQIRKV